MYIRPEAGRRIDVYLRAVVRGLPQLLVALISSAVVLIGSGRPDFRPSSPPTRGTECYEAELEFVVDATGSPELETARVVRTNSPSFAESAMRALAQFRYEPAQMSGEPVRQIVELKSGMAAVTTVVPAGQVPRPPLRPPRC